MAVDKLEPPPAAPVAPGEANMAPQTFRYSPLRFLHVMLAIAWSAVTHPFSSSVIDLATGRVYSTDEG